MILLMKKTKRDPKEILFIEEADPTQERWYGRKVTVDEAKEVSQIEEVRFLESFDGERFCELVDKIIVESNERLRFRLKNGLELAEAIERTVR